MDGSIGVESRPDKGSTFHFTLKLGVGSTNDAPSSGNTSPREMPLPAAPMVTALNILLAEDNLVNQKLAMTLLGKWGHRVRLANNGREAVEFSASEPFDLILMDVQMPLLGGIEATRLIRERETEVGNHVRIVAMTANAMAGDREACIDAGMDDYLTKPLKKEVLAAILDPSPSDPQQLAEGPEQNGMFDYAAALTSADSWVIEVIGETFRKDWPKQVKIMQAAIGNGERDVLLRGAHTLKGLLGNFNASPAQALARKLELLATQGEFEQSTPCLAELAVALGLLDRALETFTQTVQ